MLGHPIRIICRNGGNGAEDVNFSNSDSFRFIGALWLVKLFTLLSEVVVVGIVEVMIILLIMIIIIIRGTMIIRTIIMIINN